MFTLLENALCESPHWVDSHGTAKCQVFALFEIALCEFPYRVDLHGMGKCQVFALFENALCESHHRVDLHGTVKYARCLPGMKLLHVDLPKSKHWQLGGGLQP